MSPARFAVPLTLVGVLLLSACGGAPTGDGESAAGEDGASSTATDADGGGGAEPTTVTVEHAMGTTEIPCDPESVVALGQGERDSVFALGLTPVGHVAAWTDEWYAYLPDEVEDIPVLGTELEPDLEAIAALQPDVILGSKIRHEEIFDSLSQIAPTVFAEVLGTTWRENFELYADALCRDEEAAEILADWDQRVASFREALETQTPEAASVFGEPDVVEISLIRFRSAGVRIYLEGFAGTIMDAAGLARPPEHYLPDEPDSPYLEISEEQIPMMDGDLILVMLSNWTPGDDALRRQEAWTNEDLWGQLAAVQAEQVYTVNEDHWNLGGGILAAHELLNDLEELFGLP